MQHVFAVILAGGSGTRFWPASRRSRPKQLLPLGPETSCPLIEATVRRLGSLVAPDHVLIATGADLLDATRRALPALPESSFLGEPYARNTAACIGWAASIARRRDPEAIVMVLPSDHHVVDEPRFREMLAEALESARSGDIATVGFEPTRPDTGFGYIELGDAVRPGVRRGVRFVEKPDAKTATAYVESGRYAWNGGMFFFRAERLLGAVREHLPELSAGLERIESAAKEGPARELAETRAVFEKLPSVSIDVGVMEKLPGFHVVSGSVGWSDLGSWESAWELASKDAAGNAAPEHGLVVDGQRNLLVDLRSAGQQRVMVALGVEDLCIVETDDALLVMKRGRSQDVRLIVDELRRRGRDDKL